MEGKSSNSQDDSPGMPFLFLRPYLVHVYRAGYYSDYIPFSPELDRDYAYDFQSAQSALVPTMLDYEKPWDFDFVILNLARPQALASILKRWPSRMVVYSGDFNVVLIQRLKS